MHEAWLSELHLFLKVFPFQKPLFLRNSHASVIFGERLRLQR